jgi:hypothetical protein
VKIEKGKGKLWKELKKVPKINGIIGTSDKHVERKERKNIFSVFLKNNVPTQGKDYNN